MYHPQKRKLNDKHDDRYFVCLSLEKKNLDHPTPGCNMSYSLKRFETVIKSYKFLTYPLHPFTEFNLHNPFWLVDILNFMSSKTIGLQRCSGARCATGPTSSSRNSAKILEDETPTVCLTLSARHLWARTDLSPKIFRV